MLIDFQTLFAFSSAVAVLAISPGPDNIYVGLQSVQFGVKKAFVVILGLMSGCLIHTSLLALGFSVLLKEYPSLLISIKIAGAGYLFYLAISLFRSGAPQALSSRPVENRPLPSLYLQGLLMNLLNPKVSLFFLSLFPGFLFLPGTEMYLQFYALGLVFIGVSTLVFTGIALLASKLFSDLGRHTTFFNRLHWAQILLFIGIGIFLLLP